MTTFVSTAALALALAACSSVPPDPPDDPGSPTWPGTPGSGAGTMEPDKDGKDDDLEPPPVPRCLDAIPSGAVELELELELELGDTNDFTQKADVAVDRDDDVLHALPRTASSPLFGLTKLSNDLVTLYTRPFGDLVATDDDNHVFVTGLFDRTIDFGFGPDAPHGDGHAYLAKLDRNGKPLFVKELPPCGTLEVVSIAADAPGKRVAVSGAGAGTLILDGDDGRELLRIPLVGDVAFDSRGDIIIAGELDSDAFVAKLDAWGNERFRLTFAESTAPEHTEVGDNRQAGVGVTVDREDNILVVGEFEATINLFGDNYAFITPTEVGDVDGGFVLKLDPKGALVWKFVREALDMADVAVDPLDHVLVSGTGLGALEPFSIPFVFKVHATTGTILWSRDQLPGMGYGSAGGVASDACGHAFWAATARVSPFDEALQGRAFLLRLAL